MNSIVVVSLFPIILELPKKKTLETHIFNFSVSLFFLKSQNSSCKTNSIVARILFFELVLYRIWLKFNILISYRNSFIKCAQTRNRFNFPWLHHTKQIFLANTYPTPIKFSLTERNIYRRVEIKSSVVEMLTITKQTPIINCREITSEYHLGDLSLILEFPFVLLFFLYWKHHLTKHMQIKVHMITNFPHLAKAKVWLSKGKEKQHKKKQRNA